MNLYPCSGCGSRFCDGECFVEDASSSDFIGDVRLTKVKQSNITDDVIIAEENSMNNPSDTQDTEEQQWLLLARDFMRKVCEALARISR